MQEQRSFWRGEQACFKKSNVTYAKSESRHGSWIPIRRCVPIFIATMGKSVGCFLAYRRIDGSFYGKKCSIGPKQEKRSENLSERFLYKCLLQNLIPKRAKGRWNGIPLSDLLRCCPDEWIFGIVKPCVAFDEIATHIPFDVGKQVACLF